MPTFSHSCTSLSFLYKFVIPVQVCHSCPNLLCHSCTSLSFLSKFIMSFLYKFIITVQVCHVIHVQVCHSCTSLSCHSCTSLSFLYKFIIPVQVCHSWLLKIKSWRTYLLTLFLSTSMSVCILFITYLYATSEGSLWTYIIISYVLGLISLTLFGDLNRVEAARPILFILVRI